MLTISAADVNCERVFNFAEALYDHRKSYNSTIFFAMMMIRFHDQKKNSQAKLNADLAIEEKMINEDLNKKMKKRVSELQIVYNELYISDDDEEDDNSQDTSTRRSTAIRCLIVFIILYFNV
jgi:hypothetical protein